MNYRHLTHEERYQISVLKKAGKLPAEIACLLGRHKSTISRELSRNGSANSYRPAQAQKRSESRRMACANGPRIPEETWSFVDEKLGELWSPEQISGYLKANDQPTVSHESIYQHVYEDKKAGGCLHQALRCQKARRKRYGSKDRRGAIPNQTSIDQRPAVVETRERLGDWEADLVIGAGQQGALVTLNERRSRFTLMAYVETKEAQTVSDTIIRLLKPFAGHVHTLTTDNGKEFAQHERIAKQLKAEFYFAHPYSSWERGANENMNGLIRQFFPKKMPFHSVSKRSVKKAQDMLNHRPRKCLNYKTPFQVFMNELQLTSTVALQG
jgi:transposase, IS30 family